MVFEAEFPSLSDCLAHLRQHHPPGERLSSTRDIDTGVVFRGAFPRWLYRGESKCYPVSRPGLWRLRHSGSPVLSEVEAITDFACKYTVHHLVLPYTMGLDHFDDPKWLALSATYEALAFCQHYGLPTAFVDFTMSPDIAAKFASNCPPQPDSEAPSWGRIAVLDCALARDHSQIIDLRHFSATRAARQKGFALYLPGHSNLCDPRIRRRVGLTWYRFRQQPDASAKSRSGLPALLRTDNDRLAGWIRHAISVYARQVQPVGREAAAYLCGRIPIVPLVAERREGQGNISFLTPGTIQFDGRLEASRTMLDWTRDRAPADPGKPFRVYRAITGSQLVRFTGT